MYTDHDHTVCVDKQAWLDEPITVKGSDLLMLAGQIALPPFVGHPEAGSWDCAPLAEDITAKVQAFHEVHVTARASHDQPHH